MDDFGTFTNAPPSAPVTLESLRAAWAGIKPVPPVAVRIRMHPEAITLLRSNVPAALGGPQPLAVQVEDCAYLAKHIALIDMSDGTIRTVDMRPRVKQSLHDCRGMKRGAFKRYRRLNFRRAGPYNHAEVIAARDRWIAACERLDLAVQQRERKTP